VKNVDIFVLQGAELVRNVVDPGRAGKAPEHADRDPQLLGDRLYAADDGILLGPDLDVAGLILPAIPPVGHLDSLEVLLSIVPDILSVFRPRPIHDPFIVASPILASDRH